MNSLHPTICLINPSILLSGISLTSAYLTASSTTYLGVKRPKFIELLNTECNKKCSFSTIASS